MGEKDKAGHRERLRESFLRGEGSVLTDEKLLELLLTYAIRQKDVRPLAEQLIGELGDLDAVLAADTRTLCRFKGIKDHSATLLKLVHSVKVRTSPTRTETTIVSQEDGGQQSLFEPPVSVQGAQRPKTRKATRKVVSRKGTGLFGKAVLKEAIYLLPSLPDTSSIDDIREHLRRALHFSAEQTRKRYSNYITRRMFPEGYPDKPLLHFAKAFPETQDLREVCFYRFLNTEPLEIDVIENLIVPNIGNGRVSRERIRKYLSERFPEARSIIDSGKAVVDALTAAGIARADKTRVTFSYRDIPVFAFAFILHSEFPDPGMFDIQKVEQNRLIRAMLWKPDRLLPLLYELRNQGLISKVSEIDTVRQFTTKLRLNEVVDRLMAKVGNS